MAYAFATDEKLDFETYLAFYRERPDRERWELIDGVAYLMMTPPSGRHQQIALNLTLALAAEADRLGETWAPYQGAGVHRSEAKFFAPEPDIVVQRPPAPEGGYWNDPLVIIEVLSPSTRNRDRGPKRLFAMGIPTLLHYVLVEQTKMQVEMWSRSEDGWRKTVRQRADQSLDLAGLSASIPLSRIYRHTGLADAV